MGDLEAGELLLDVGRVRDDGGGGDLAHVVGEEGDGADAAVLGAVTPLLVVAGAARRVLEPAEERGAEAAERLDDGDEDEIISSLFAC